MKTAAQLSFLFIIIFSLSSCNNNNNLPKRTDTANQSADSSNAFQAENIQFQPALKTLLVSKTAFINWYSSHTTSKLMFQFKVISDGNITLAGWASKDEDNYEPNPGVVLEVTNNIALELKGREFFFGNLRLRSSEINGIKRELDKPENSRMNFLLFTPKLNSNNHIYYEISLSENRAPLTGLTLTTIAKIDPSPPATHK